MKFRITRPVLFYLTTTITNTFHIFTSRIPCDGIGSNLTKVSIYSQVYESCSVSLVIFTSHCKATRGIFWDGHRNSEPQSNDENDARVNIPSPNFSTTAAGERMATTYDLTCNRAP
ncbi:hypothetical protein AVEN_244918-1 [Araneus ventricosus]|uniref:Uncharacterized protein n=1 Tax=Araneus ventricosus TaxID=182803 RepID=A0A4Y1ZX81_ARAVE|nr:hypothetical protein AVEN_46826-1 [Araneus ventricosus]GBL72056.1 hypothetical protein AVEN_66437-1 [Araneus ventricosus]GBL72067.1 hypothetical protein AVEN_79363-1 [Araneus ventricosus]GBL72102.1 hypothetical protein AVEN_244918-1 [Araneus ventricosus]